MSIQDRSDAAPPASPEPEACRAQLRRILSSSAFDATDRDRRFLAYVVEETLAGRASRIKAYAIATEVFGRDASFDPQSDPIVRVEAGHLRRALDRYYLGAGRADPIEISIPKGGYVPTFAVRSAPPDRSVDPAPKPAPPTTADSPPPRRFGGLVAAGLVLAAAALGAFGFVWRSEAPRAAQPDIPRLLVLPFEARDSAGEATAVALGLGSEVIGQLSKFKDLLVVTARPGEAPADNPDARYVLSGNVDLEADQIRVQARLQRRVDGAVLWAESYVGDLGASRLIEIEADVARDVAATLAQPYGVIFQADSDLDMESPPDDWKAYSCTLAYYAYRAELDPQVHPAIRACLEEATARFPDYATAWALLSQIYIDEFRFRFAPDPQAGPASVERALAAAKRAVALDPNNVRGQQAMMFALYFDGDIDASLAVGEAALRINPNDGELMGEYGYRLALAGRWAEGCALVEEARARNPGPLGYFEGALALCAYFADDHERAAMWVRRTRLPANPNYHLIAAVVFAEAGLSEDAAAEIDWLRRNAAGVLADARGVVASRVARPEDVERLLASLRKAEGSFDALQWPEPGDRQP